MKRVASIIFTGGLPGSRQLVDDLKKGKVAFVYYDKERGGVFGFGYLTGYTEGSRQGAKVLLIDEINRGNIPKIFGELLYALEYRGEKIKLQYSGADPQAPEAEKYLSIPENLYIIGTMNTADRSISLVDVALRRRFHFIPFMPDYDLLANTLGLGDSLDHDVLMTRYGQSTDQAEKRKIMSILALIHINGIISRTAKLGKDKQLGHSFFMSLRDNQGETFLIVWRYDILPLLEEYFYGNNHEMTKIFTDSIVDSASGIRDFSEGELTAALGEDVWVMEEPLTESPSLTINELDESEPLKLTSEDIAYLQSEVNGGNPNSRIQLIPLGDGTIA